MFDLTPMIYAFYVNEFINAILLQEKEESTYLKSHKKFRNDFFTMRKKFNDILAHVLHDYIIYVTALELPNSYEYCDFTVRKFLGFSIDYCYDNDSFIEDNYHKLHIPSFINICEKIFYKSYWNYEYFGGEKWWAGMKYIRDIYPKDKAVFIDSVIDLEHNTDTLFNKPNPFFYPLRASIQEFLNDKKEVTDSRLLFTTLLSWFKYNTICNELAQLYRRFAYLYMANIPNLDFIVLSYLHLIPNDYCAETYWKNFLRYKPIEFTGEYRKYQLIDSDILHDENEYDSDEYYA